MVMQVGCKSVLQTQKATDYRQAKTFFFKAHESNYACEHISEAPVSNAFCSHPMAFTFVFSQ